MSQIRTLVFDMGNTIVPFDVQRGIAEMAKHSSVPANEIWPTLQASGVLLAFERGELTPEEFRANVCQQLQMDLSAEAFDAIWNSIFLPEALISEALVEKLKQQYRLIVLSNTNAIHVAYVREHYPVLKHFHHFVFSHEVGHTKPEPQIYEAAIAVAAAWAEECFYTDDVAAYVEGAAEVGFQAEHFQGEAELVRQLKARGVSLE